MSDCRYRVSSVNYPDPDPDPETFLIYKTTQLSMKETHAHIHFYKTFIVFWIYFRHISLFSRVEMSLRITIFQTWTVKL